MKLVVTLLARDEIDIISYTVDYYLNNGADFIVATDNLSRDGTREVLLDYAREGVLHLIDEPHDNHAQQDWVTRMARLAKTKYGADWVLNVDADEFWWPREGDLKTPLEDIPKEYGQAQVTLSNFLIVRDSTAGLPFFGRQLIRERDYMYYLGAHTAGKVFHRGDPKVFIFNGIHEIGNTNLAMSPVKDYYLILHFPVRSYEQFAKKIENGGRALANSPFPYEVGKEWRECYTLHQQGRLYERYKALKKSVLEIETGLVSGALLYDSRLRDSFRQLYHYGQD